MPKPRATSQQMSLLVAMHNNAIPISHLPSLTLASETPKVSSIPTAHNPRLILGQTQVLSQMKYSDCKWRWTGSTYNQGIHRHPLQKAGIWLPSKWGPNCQSHQGGEDPLNNHVSETLRLCVQQLSGRWRPPVQSTPTSYNNHMGNICRKWRGKPLRRKGGIASLF